MKIFLRETWELWYWAMFCPSKLQKRMNEWAPKKEKGDTDFSDILLTNISWRFAKQVLLLIGLFSLPLLNELLVSATTLSWILLPTALISAYGTAFWFLPAALHLSLIFSLVYMVNPITTGQNLSLGAQAVLQILPPIQQVSLGIGLGAILLGLNSAGIYALLKKKRLNISTGKIFSIVGSSIAVASGSWLSSQSLLFTTLITGGTALFLYFFRDQLIDSEDAGGVAVVVAVGVAGVATLPLPEFLLATALIAFGLSYARQRQLGLWTGIVFVALGFEQLGWLSVFALPIAVAFYYRFIPEYVYFSSVPVNPIYRLFYPRNSKGLTRSNSKIWLRRLPPFSSELLWLAVPGHEQLLADVFPLDPELGLKALQGLQTSPLPGPQHTARKALPLIVASHLLAFQDIHNFQQLLTVSKESKQQGLLTVLLPKFYTFTDEQDDDNSTLSDPELASILPRLRNISQDTDSAMQASNLALKERGLEAIRNRLSTLPSQLPGLGLSSQAIKRWTPVIHRWERILNYELAEQQKLSQGELSNPFQYGNPLQRSRTDLFKGRRTFAENIARILLDRNRPTIVLHGPRRCGKTSFLNNLPRLLPSQWIPIFVDAQSAAATTDEAGFCQSLVRAIKRDGRVQGLKFPPLPTRAEFLAAPYIVLEDWLTTTLEALKVIDPEKRLLLTIDEFEKIGTAIDAGKLTTSLFDELRNLIQHWDQLGFVFSGVQTLDELGPNWSSYFISVVPVEMLYLEPSEARALLTNPDPDFALTYAPGLIDEILHLTQCHPNLLQLIGAALVTEANEHHTTTATAHMLQAAIPRAFTLGTSYFTNVWTEFTGSPDNPAEVHTGQTLLKALANGTQPASGNDEQTNKLTKAALRRMERYHVLKRTEGQYEFDIPLIQRWVKERAILE